MKAVQLTAVGEPLQERQVEIPEVADTEVRVRVCAAGVCHSDAHYRSGTSPVGRLPLTPGHEVAGVVDAVGAGVDGVVVGDRVGLHYMVTCGECDWCHSDREQFCRDGQMIGKARHGGYAQYIVVPARNVLVLPDEIPFEHAAIMMCSSATSLHALRRARVGKGDTVAVIGAGGLGFSAVQLAFAEGAARVYAVDINPVKLTHAKQLGAVPIQGGDDAVSALRDATNGRGADVTLELVGLPETIRQAIAMLATHGRAAIAGLCDRDVQFHPYRELVNPETDLLGVSDHTYRELEDLVAYYRAGQLVFNDNAVKLIALASGPINDALDNLDNFGDNVRIVVIP